MNEKTLTTDKNDVYEEVAKTTSYAGAKTDDATAYDKIFTTDADKEMLERFWQESKKIGRQPCYIRSATAPCLWGEM